jgi:hypothetical protein
MGIGYGSFLAYGFAFEDSPKLKYISSQFLGSAVIHATETEKSVQGLRIGVHESAAQMFYDKEFSEYKLLRLPDEESQPGLTFEWNYFGQWSDNFYAPAYPNLDAGQMKAILKHIAKMKELAPNEARVQSKYEKTERAIKRMGIAIATAEEDPRFQQPEGFQVFDPLE